MVKGIFETTVVTVFGRKEPTFALYAQGEWDHHMMDWRGMNCRWVKVPAPSNGTFSNPTMAREWLKRIETFGAGKGLNGQSLKLGDYTTLVLDGVEVGNVTIYEESQKLSSVKGEGFAVSDYANESNNAFCFRQKAVMRFEAGESWDALAREYRSRFGRKT